MNVRIVTEGVTLTVITRLAATNVAVMMDRCWVLTGTAVMVWSFLYIYIYIYISIYIYIRYFTWIVPKAARTAVSLYEGASPRVTGFESRSVDQ